MLRELDEIFDGVASPAYLGHVAQDWSAEPFVRQAYLADDADWQVPRTLGRPVGERLFFAGDAYTDGENWSEVHVAAASARWRQRHSKSAAADIHFPIKASNPGEASFPKSIPLRKPLTATLQHICRHDPFHVTSSCAETGQASEPWHQH